MNGCFTAIVPVQNTIRSETNEMGSIMLLFWNGPFWPESTCGGSQSRSQNLGSGFESVLLKSYRLRSPDRVCLVFRLPTHYHTVVISVSLTVAWLTADSAGQPANMDNESLAGMANVTDLAPPPDYNEMNRLAH